MAHESQIVAPAGPKVDAVVEEGPVLARRRGRGRPRGVVRGHQRRARRRRESEHGLELTWELPVLKRAVEMEQRLHVIKRGPVGDLLRPA